MFPELTKRVRKTISRMGDCIAFPQIFPATYWWFAAKTLGATSPTVWYCQEPTPILYDTRALRDVPMALRIAAAGLQLPLYVADRLLFAHADQILTNSQYTAERIRRIYHQDATVIHPGVDRVERSMLDSRDRLVLCIGKLVSFKRFDTCLRAFAMMERRAHIGAKLVIVGEGPAYDQLLRLAKSLNIADQVKIVPNVSEATLRMYYSRARVHLASAIGEAFGLTVIESLSAGTPVVAARSGGYRDSVSHGVTGYLVDPNDTVGFSNAVESLLTDDELWETMSKKASAITTARFSWHSTVDRLAEVFENVAN